MNTQTVTDYLLTRLAQAGLASVFGVPGDCNLPVLDAVAGRPELAWIGMATEQGAGYAADSYARLRGLIVLNNGGYTTELAMGHPDAAYHDIPAWDWTALPAAVAPASSAVALRVRSSHELAWALDAADYHANAGRPVLIEAVLGANDIPPLLRDLTRALADR